MTEQGLGLPVAIDSRHRQLQGGIRLDVQAHVPGPGGGHRMMRSLCMRVLGPGLMAWSVYGLAQAEPVPEALPVGTVHGHPVHRVGDIGAEVRFIDLVEEFVGAFEPSRPTAYMR